MMSDEERESNPELRVFNFLSMTKTTVYSYYDQLQKTNQYELTKSKRQGWIQIHLWIFFPGLKSGSVKDGQIVDARVAGAAAPDDHGLVGKLVPAVDLHVRDAVVADLEVSHRAEDGDEDDHEGGVAEPDRGGQAALMLH